MTKNSFKATISIDNVYIASSILQTQGSFEIQAKEGPIAYFNINKSSFQSDS